MEEEQQPTPQPPHPPNRGGAPYGNQNARKHGFYSATLSETERDALQTAAEMRGIDEEIAVLRVKIQSLIRSNHGNVRLVIEATSALARLLKIRDKLSGPKDDAHERALTTIYRDWFLPALSKEEAAIFIEQQLLARRRLDQDWSAL